MSAAPAVAVRLIGYCRVSTERQAQDDRWGPDRQRQEISDYARRTFGRAVDEMHLDAITGKRERREKLDAILAQARQGDVIVIPAVNRLGRKELTNHLLLEELIEAGLEVHSSDDGRIDPENASSMLMFSIKSAMAANDLRTIRRQTLGSKMKMAEGGEGRPPQIPTNWLPYGVGYRRVNRDREWWVIPEQAAVIRRIYELAARGEGTTRIARILHADGVPTQRGAVWNDATLRKMIRNPAYKGIVQVKFKTPMGERVFNIPSPVGAFVDEALWERANANIKGKAWGELAQCFPLTGLVRCGVCGATMSGRMRVAGANRLTPEGRSAAYASLKANPDQPGVGFRYFMCNAAYKGNTLLTPGIRRCDHRIAHRADVIEKSVELALTDLATNPMPYVRQVTDRDKEKIEALRSEKAATEKLKAKLENDYVNGLPGPVFTKLWNQAEEKLERVNRDLAAVEASGVEDNWQAVMAAAMGRSEGLSAAETLVRAGAFVYVFPEGRIALGFELPVLSSGEDGGDGGGGDGRKRVGRTWRAKGRVSTSPQDRTILQESGNKPGRKTIRFVTIKKAS